MDSSRIQNSRNSATAEKKIVYMYRRRKRKKCIEPSNTNDESRHEITCLTQEERRE
jgi:hypothetical protein